MSLLPLGTLSQVAGDSGPLRAFSLDYLLILFFKTAVSDQNAVTTERLFPCGAVCVEPPLDARGSERAGDIHNVVHFQPTRPEFTWTQRRGLCVFVDLIAERPRHDVGCLVPSRAEAQP